MKVDAYAPDFGWFGDFQMQRTPKDGRIVPAAAAAPPQKYDRL